MKIYELFEALINKFVPMNDLTRNNLSSEAVDSYGKLNAERLDIERWNSVTKLQNEKALEADPDASQVPLKPVPIKYKVIGVLEQWWLRYIFALLFIYLVPKVKAYMTGDVSHGHDDLDDDDEYEEWKEYQRFKKGMR